MTSASQEPGAPRVNDALGPDNPFPGLRPYLENDADWFFGRDQEINDLLRKLRQTHFLAVVGPSGCGKSSLIRAGVLRSLHDGFLDAAWLVAEFTPGGGPIQELTKALQHALNRPLEPDSLRQGPESLIDAVQSANISGKQRVVVFADQFEELFRYEDDGGPAAREEVKAFLKLLLAAAISDEPPVYVVITMRMEFLKRSSGYVGFAEAFNEGIYLVPQMTRKQFRQAIVGPIVKAQASITANLVDRLLNDLDGQTDQLPVLEHGLLQMWGPARSGRALDLDHYKAIGTLSNCLSQHVQDVYAALSPQQKLLTERLFRVITEVTVENQRIRRPRTLGEICRMLQTDINTIGPVMEAFAAPGRHFLVTSPLPPLTGSTVIDISHEALLRQWTTLRVWLDAEAELRLEKRKVEDAAAAWARLRAEGFLNRVFKSRSFLYRGLNLKRALRTEPTLSAEARKFLGASRWNRLWNRIGFVVLIVAFLFFPVRGYLDYQQAEKKILETTTAKAIAERNSANAQRAEGLSNTALAVKCAVLKDCSSETLTSLTRAVEKVKKATVFLQIGDASQRSCAKLIRNRLLDSYDAPGIEAVSNVPAHTEVRYFHTDDAKAAAVLADDIKQFANLPEAGAKLITGFESKVPVQQFEVWFSSDFTCAAVEQTDFRSIVQDVHAVVSSSGSGAVLPKSREWAVIVTGAGTGSPALVAARQDGQGHVAAVGHEWLLQNVSPAYRDNALFDSNLIAWLDVRKQKKVVYTAGHREWLADPRPPDDLAQVLGKHQFTLRRLPGPINKDALAQSSVVIIGNAWADFRDDEIAAVQNYVRGGGGLLLAGVGWSWVGYNSGKTMNDYPMTKMAKPYEMSWLDSVITAPAVPGLAQSGLFARFYPHAQ